MALTAAGTAAAVSLGPLLSRPGCVLRCGRRLAPLLLRATSTSTASAPDFNITFAEPTPTKKAPPRTSTAEPPVPWIVRGKDGKPALQTAPPPEVLQAIALAEADARKKAKKESPRTRKGELAVASASVKVKDRKTAPAGPPKFSKAARRFYNENIKESEPQRLAKVLAAAGGILVRRLQVLNYTESKEINNEPWMWILAYTSFLGQMNCTIKSRRLTITSQHKRFSRLHSYLCATDTSLV